MFLYTLPSWVILLQFKWNPNNAILFGVGIVFIGLTNIWFS